MPFAVHDFFAMGSDCAIYLVAGSVADGRRIAGAAEVEIRRIEARYSRFRDDSELARINRAASAGGRVAIDAETAALIAYARVCFDKSGGAFDITSGVLREAWNFSVPRLPAQRDIAAILPRIGLDKVSLAGDVLSFAQPGMALDFGGIGKEYAADRAAEICAGLGARHGFVNLGGDLRVIGPQPDGQAWRIGIRDPARPTAIVATIGLIAGALATSGDYERCIDVDGRRYGHILDPRTGWPVQGLSSVTVIAETCLVAGSLATIAMLKGQAGGGWLREQGVAHLVIDASGACSGSGGWIRC